MSGSTTSGGAEARERASVSEPPVVLIVDDDRSVLGALKRALDDGFSVVTFDSARDAVEHLRKSSVSVVLSDIEMPEMTGLELLRQIRHHDPDLPVMLITGFPALESAAKAIEYGVFRYLEKPFDPNVLKASVQQASRLYRLAQMKREALGLVHKAGASDRVGLEVSFRRALESIWIAFQPIVSASRRSVFGYEALLRSDDPTLPTPVQLLDAAQRLDALQELGRLARRRAAEAIRARDDELLLFVNLHPKDLADPELVDPNSPLSTIAHRVVLEITERASLRGLEDLQATVGALRALGYRVAIDDLGAGYAGLASFALLEPEIVKIDMSLTRGIEQNPVKQKLVGSMSALCREMGMTIVIEGVETPNERDTAVSLGCDLLQGYLFARPARDFPEPAW